MSQTRQERGLILKIVTVWVAIFLVGGFLYAVQSVSRPVSMSVIPEVPRQGEPIVVTFNLNNPSLKPLEMEYEFYANGELLRSGATTLSPLSSKKYRYAYENPLELGEQVNFVLRATSGDNKEYEEVLSLPAYPPQVWSSFVSFASFSTSLMGFMSTMVYYEDSFGTGKGLSVGVTMSAVLIALLVFLELTMPRFREKTLTTIGSLRLRFRTLSAILFVIFMGMVYTTIVLILAT